jgi:hypothetical protein
MELRRRASASQETPGPANGIAAMPINYPGKTLSTREKVGAALIWGTAIVVGIGLLWWMSWAAGD